MGFPQDNETWPIKAKGKVARLNPLGDPKIEKLYHKSLEQGRVLETSISDANLVLLEKKDQLLQRVQTYTDMNKLAVDGQFKHRLRKFKYIADSISLLQTVSSLQKDVIGIISACTQNVGTLSMIEQNMRQMVQANLNAIANLMNNICNWGIPDIPAIPNFFSDTVWLWNGFNFFPLAAFNPKLTFQKNFAFNMCILHVPNINIFRNYPSSVQTYSGLSYGTVAFAPPLGGLIPDTGTNLSDPNIVAQYQNSSTDPYFLPVNLTGTMPAGATNTPFNPNSSMLGAVPDPNTIINNYQMPAQTYHDNIVSILPTLRQNTVEPTDADYSNPNLTVRDPNLRKDLIHYVNLQQVVDSNYDPYTVSAWLFYLDLARNGRAGTWLNTFEAAYKQFISPSITSLAGNTVPWNNVLPGTELHQTPMDIPLVDVLKALANDALNVVLWQLSYVEASLLGYTRNTTWDTAQNTVLLSGATGSDLDYRPTAFDANVTTSTTVGVGTAQFPVTLVYPSAINLIMQEVIAQATQDIADAPTYESPRLGNRFTYNQFAQATLVDRFSQFWRDFNTNLKNLLAQDPFLIQYAVTYFGTLNGALNPLGDQTAYNQLLADVAARNRSWTPGTPLLPLPIAPIVKIGSVANGSGGWSGDVFDPSSFLARPDIQALPIPVQTAMLRTNLSYQAIQQFSSDMSQEIEGQIANATSLLTALQQFGFEVEALGVTTTVPVGSGGAQVVFDTIDFDLTGNVTLPSGFIIQSTGSYAVFGTINWATGPANGVRTITVLQNGQPFLSQDTDPSVTGPTTIAFSDIGNFTAGDVVEVVATHTFGSSQTLAVGSMFSMVQTGATEAPVQIPPDNTNSSKNFTISASQPAWVIPPIPALTVFQVNKVDGTITPLDPLVPTISNIAITGAPGNYVVVATVPAHHFVASDLIVFSGVGTADFLTGVTASVTTVSPTTVTAALDPALVIPGWAVIPYNAVDTGSILYAIDSSGAVLAPNPDGVMLVGGSPGDIIQAGTTFGGVYQIPGAAFTPGGLLYAGPAGLITQNYSTLITQVGWVICVGRAISADTILYEPHVPTRFSSGI